MQITKKATQNNVRIYATCCSVMAMLRTQMKGLECKGRTRVKNERNGQEVCEGGRNAGSG